MASYKLTLHKKSYLLTGITKDDENKEKVKDAGAKWNGSLKGWLFFPAVHKKGLKLAEEIGAEIDDSILENDKNETKKSTPRKSTPKKEEKLETIRLEELKELFMEFSNLVCETIDSFEGIEENMLNKKWKEFLPKIKNKVSNKKKLKKEIKKEMEKNEEKDKDDEQDDE